MWTATPVTQLHIALFENNSLQGSGPCLLQDSVPFMATAQKTISRLRRPNERPEKFEKPDFKLRKLNFRRGDLKPVCPI